MINRIVLEQMADNELLDYAKYQGEAMYAALEQCNREAELSSKWCDVANALAKKIEAKEYCDNKYRALDSFARGMYEKYIVPKEASSDA